MKLRLSPHKARPIASSEAAWWYEDRKSISVYIARDGHTHACRINRAQLKSWLDKVTPASAVKARSVRTQPKRSVR